MRAWKFTSPGGPELHAVSWESGSPKARLVFHHGYGEHCGRYDKVFAYFNERGIDCHAYDMRTFGKSEVDPKKRSKFNSYQDVVADLVSFSDQVRASSQQQLPCFIAGSSMGALMAAHACLRQQDCFSGLLLFSPSMDVDKTPMLHVQSLLGAPLEAVMPWARIVEAVRVEDMSEDEQVRKEYIDDPMNFVGPVRVRTARQLEAAMNHLKKQYPSFTLPVFGQHGTHDRCTSLRGHKAFMDSIGSTDKTLSMVEGGYHELLMGPQKDQCMSTIADWILQHASPQVKTPL